MRHGAEATGIKVGLGFSCFNPYHLLMGVAPALVDCTERGEASSDTTNYFCRREIIRRVF